MEKANHKQAAREIQKPMLRGSWHGRDAFLRGYRLMAGVLITSIMFLLLGMILLFDSLWMRLLMCAALVGLAGAYQYSKGIAAGQGDAAFGEIIYEREKEGKPIQKADRDRCYHPAKGFFAVLVGTLPFVLVALGFALLARPALYSLGVLPGWLGPLMRQNELGDALAYYGGQPGIQAMDVYRMVVRAMVMPFINAAIPLGDNAVLWVERLSPLLVIIAPLGYGFGYLGGRKARARVNASIAIGDAKKKKRARREQKRRARSNSPERLI